MINEKKIPYLNLVNMYQEAENRACSAPQRHFNELRTIGKAEIYEFCVTSLSLHSRFSAEELLRVKFKCSR